MEFEKNLTIIDNKKVFYLDNNVDGDVLVMLHGFPGNHLGLMEMADMTGSDYRIIIPDLPACGNSDPLRKVHSLENYSEWLDAFLVSLGIGKVIIMGHSFGSRVALVYSGLHPEKVGKMILITPVLRVEGLLDRIISAYYSIAGAMPEYLKRAMISNGLGKKVGDMIIFKSKDALKHKEIMDRDAEEVRKVNPRANMEIFDEFYNHDLILNSGGIGIPTLVIAGALDEVSPMGVIKELVSSLPEGELEVVRDGGHLVPLEEPQVVADIMKRWIDK
jgi:pimeloyl-ACP methyl ester carboxylesterase